MSDGFTTDDFIHTASQLRSGHEAIRRAALSNNYNIILAALDRASLPQAGKAEPVAWRCAKCGCRSFARVDAPVNDGPRVIFNPGPNVRCVNCKDVSFFPALGSITPSPEGEFVLVPREPLDELCRINDVLMDLVRSGADPMVMEEELGEATAIVIKAHRRSLAAAPHPQGEGRDEVLEEAERAVRQLLEEVSGRRNGADHRADEAFSYAEGKLISAVQAIRKLKSTPTGSGQSSPPDTEGQSNE